MSMFIEVTVETSKRSRWTNKLLIGTRYISEVRDGPSGCEIAWAGEAVIVVESYAEIRRMLG